jgi:hypothetical protein
MNCSCYVKNCVSCGTIISLTANEYSINRIGLDNFKDFNNYGWIGTSQSSTDYIPFTGGTPNNENGGDISVSDIASSSFWKDTVHFTPTDQGGPWIIKNNHLPVFKGQSDTIPLYQVVKKNWSGDDNIINKITTAKDPHITYTNKGEGYKNGVDIFTCSDNKNNSNSNDNKNIEYIAPKGYMLFNIKINNISISNTDKIIIPSFTDIELHATLSCLMAMDGNGDKNSPYKVSTVNNLICMSVEVNNNNTEVIDKYWTQINDIDFKGIINPIDPIGNSINKPFIGTYNAHGYKIKNLILNIPNTNCVGIFGVVKDSIIENIKRIDGYTKGGNNIGGIIGISIGHTTITDSINTSDIKGTYSSIGGIVGNIENNTIIKNSYNKGSINGQNSCGGIAGSMNNSTITDTYNIGDILYGNGGIVGTSYNNSCIKNSYNMGVIKGVGNTGGIVGLSINNSIVKNCVEIGNYVMGNINQTYRIGDCIDSIKENNYAYNKTSMDQNTYIPFKGYKGLNNLNGMDIDYKTIKSKEFWIGKVGLDSNIWNIENNKLPSLKDL